MGGANQSRGGVSVGAGYQFCHTLSVKILKINEELKP
jgi:hypothetical protein